MTTANATVVAHISHGKMHAAQVDAGTMVLQQLSNTVRVEYRGPMG